MGHTDDWPPTHVDNVAADVVTVGEVAGNRNEYVQETSRSYAGE